MSRQWRFHRVSLLKIPGIIAVSLVLSYHKFRKQHSYSQNNSLDEGWIVMKKLENKLENVEFVFLFDFWLDDPIVVEKFFDICARYRSDSASQYPVAWVIGGQFLKDITIIHDTSCEERLTLLFENFIQNIQSKFPELCQKSIFVFVPSIYDHVPSLLLPKIPIFIPNLSCFKNNQSAIKVHFTPNPTRIQYFTQEICVFSDDLTSRLQRNCVILPSQGDYSEHVNII